MLSREDTIKGLECCHKFENCDANGGCPYKANRDKCLETAIRDAIALLKAQEPVAPIFDYDGRDVWRCGNCHRNIFHPTRTDEDENEKNYRRFCFHCGKAVEWK